MLSPLRQDQVHVPELVPEVTALQGGTIGALQVGSAGDRLEHREVRCLRLVKAGQKSVHDPHTAELLTPRFDFHFTATPQAMPEGRHQQPPPEVIEYPGFNALLAERRGALRRTFALFMIAAGLYVCGRGALTLAG